jgi:2-dehydro-3-deoxyphosphogluconate aldolase/(4S)-4-hydroxy-2-oxoglutarate aldolase
LPLYYNADETVTLEILKSLYKAGIRAVEYTSRGESALSNFKKMVEIRNTEMPDMFLGSEPLKINYKLKNITKWGRFFHQSRFCGGSCGIPDSKRSIVQSGLYDAD